ncbi:MAG TPA: FCD domain-containing protein [Ktedonobacteraceae bacterium]
MATFQPVQTSHRSLETRIVNYIRDLVEQGELIPGDRLPPERELATQLGVSRTVLREALATLAALGLVESRHGRGVFIVAGSMQATVQRLSLALSASGLAGQGQQNDDAARIHELFEIRRVLEGAAAEWAAQRASEEQITEMRAVVQRDRKLRSATPPNRTLINELDGQLHALLAASTANRILVLLMATLLDELAISRSQSLLIPDRIARSLKQHEALIEAIAARNPVAARICMIDHLNDVEQAIIEHKENQSKVG